MVGSICPLQWVRKSSLVCGTEWSGSLSRYQRKDPWWRGCAGPRTSACGKPRVSEQPLFPSYSTTCWARKGSLGVALAISGPLSCKGAILSWKILISIWSNDLLSTQRSTEMLNGWKEKGFLAPTWLSRGTQLSLSQMQSVFERTKSASKSSAAKKM